MSGAEALPPMRTTSPHKRARRRNIPTDAQVTPACRARCRSAAAAPAPCLAQKRSHRANKPRCTSAPGAGIFPPTREYPPRVPRPVQERGRRAPPAPFPAQKRSHRANKPRCTSAPGAGTRPPCAPAPFPAQKRCHRANKPCAPHPAQKHCRRAPRAQTKIPPRTRPGGKSKRNARYFLIQLPLAARATRPCCCAYSSARENNDDTDDANRV